MTTKTEKPMSFATKTDVFCNKNRKTDLKNSQNRKTENPNAPLLFSDLCYGLLTWPLGKNYVIIT